MSESRNDNSGCLLLLALAIFLTFIAADEVATKHETRIGDLEKRVSDLESGGSR